MDLLLQQTTQISFERNAKILIEDPDDVDMTIVFRLDNDSDQQRSYTKYNVIDRQNGEIIIYNIGTAKTVSLKEPMLLGSYKNDYRLYVNFIVTAAEDASLPYTIEISFYISKD